MQLVVNGTPYDIEAAPLATLLHVLREEVAARVVDTVGDAHASQAYRRQLTAGLLCREISRAYLKSVNSLKEMSTA